MSALLLLALLVIPAGMLLVAAVIEGIARRRADHDCAGFWCPCNGAARGR